MKPCVRCGKTRSIKFMKQAVIRGDFYYHDLPVDVWACSSNETCRKNRKETR